MNKQEYNREYSRQQRQNARRAMAYTHAKNILEMVGANPMQNKAWDKVADYLLKYCKFSQVVIK